MRELFSILSLSVLLFGYFSIETQGISSEGRLAQLVRHAPDLKVAAAQLHSEFSPLVHDCRNISEISRNQIVRSIAAIESSSRSTLEKSIESLFLWLTSKTNMTLPDLSYGLMQIKVGTALKHQELAKLSNSELASMLSDDCDNFHIGAIVISGKLQPNVECDDYECIVSTVMDYTGQTSITPEVVLYAELVKLMAENRNRPP